MLTIPAVAEFVKQGAAQRHCYTTIDTVGELIWWEH
jgi:hypothetical protein